MTRSRNQIGPLISQLKEACRRPLFTEICLDEAKQSESDGAGTINGQSLPVTSKADTTTSSVTGSEAHSLAPVVSSSSANQNQPKNDSSKLSWRELLKEASRLLPYMTEDEHGEVSHLVAILLLGFLLPFSTGNDFFLLQHPLDSNFPALTRTDNLNNSNFHATTHTPSTNGSSNTTNNNIITNYILDMKLEERLENTSRHYGAFEFGEFDTLTDSSWELAFDSFLREGLAPFLGGRPAPYQNVDLLHLLAMAIHPQASESFIPDTAASLEGKHFWENVARRLMNNRHAHSFHLNYGHRLKLVKMLVHDLVIPSYDPNLPMVNCPLFDGAVPHLRASLHAFAMGATSMQDGHWARSVLVTIAIQCNLEVVRKEEWEFLINRIVDDRTVYPGCKCCPRMLSEKHLVFFGKKECDAEGYGGGHDDANFCPHAGRGQNLAQFLIRTCQARRHADTDFLNEAFSSLTDAIEWQMHCWRQQPDEAEETDSVEPPCMLASLLFAARTFFYFLLPDNKSQRSDDGQDDEQSDTAVRREELQSYAIQLLHHFDPNIASQAAELLSLSLAYDGRSADTFSQPLYFSLQLSLDAICSNGSDADYPLLLQSSTRNVVTVASRLSPSFALSFLNCVLKKIKTIQSGEAKEQDVIMKDATNDEDKVAATDESLQKSRQMRFLLQLVYSVSISNPIVAAGKTEDLLELLREVPEDSSRGDVIAALMACRQARFFVKEKDPGDSAVLGAIDQISDRWSLYQLAHLALRTGNFAASDQCYKKLLKSPLSEQYFLWITALSKIANSELCLSKHAAKGIPPASISLRSALSILLSLNALDRSQVAGGYSRPTILVTLRLDFVDLLTGLRQLIREMRLTGVGPVKRTNHYTRSSLHFQNIVRCFDALANRYRRVYEQYGLFSCQQSRTSLRTLHTICRFVARVIRTVFSDIYTSQKKEDNSRASEPRGDLTLPISRFMQRIDEQLVPSMGPAIDLVIRAAAMLEVVDGILLCPVPFPLDLLTVSRPPRGHIQLSADPDQAGIDGNEGASDNQGPELDTIECYPGISFDFYACGEVPSSFLDKSNLPFTTILLWHRAEYTGPLQEDEHNPDEKQDDEPADEKQEDDITGAEPNKAVPRPWDYTLVTTSMRMSGKFSFKVECPPIREEGNYTIDVKLGCRDVRGGEWEISVAEESRKIKIQATRSVWQS